MTVAHLENFLRIRSLFKESFSCFRVEERDRPGRRLVPLEFSPGTLGGLPVR